MQVLHPIINAALSAEKSFAKTGCLLINWHPVGYCRFWIPIRDMLTILFAWHQEQLIGSKWKMGVRWMVEVGVARRGRK